MEFYSGLCRYVGCEKSRCEHVQRPSHSLMQGFDINGNVLKQDFPFDLSTLMSTFLLTLDNSHTVVSTPNIERTFHTRRMCN